MTDPTTDDLSATEIALKTEARRAAARALRAACPRSAHGHWKVRPKGRDVVAMLEKSSAGRLADLVPIRYGRMLKSPFAFLRGAASLMAYDLSETPTSGIRTQIGGDCHLMNFGEFGTPERNIIFDINDFDETLPGPWEWDIKRLCASIVLAGRHRGFAEADNQNAVLAAAHSYRDKMAEFAAMSPLQCWYSRIDADQLAQLSSTALVSRRLAAEVMRARSQTGEALLAKTTELVDGQRRIKDTPPLLFHPQHWPGFEKQMRTVFQRYRLTVPDDRRHLLDRYKLVDVALKVVGVGSVGTRCAVALLMNDARAPLFLQFKEAREWVLGWARQPDSGTDYYVRQLRDMKNAIDIDAVVLPELMDYARFCGWALARAHAKAGDAGAISAYLGKSDVIGHALVKFAVSYADQSEADHAV